MKTHSLFLGGILAGLLCGCQTAPVRPVNDAPATVSIRNNSYSLLHQLLDEEKDVSKLRFIKRENTDLKALLKRVAAESKTGAKQLETFAQQDPTLRLTDYLLPPGEVKTRDDIAKAEQHELFHQSNDRLEFTLLLTQVEALNYAAHLAKIAGQNDTQPERARYLATLSAEMAGLREEIISRVILSPAVASGK